MSRVNRRGKKSWWHKARILRLHMHHVHQSATSEKSFVLDVLDFAEALRTFATALLDMT